MAATENVCFGNELSANRKLIIRDVGRGRSSNDHPVITVNVIQSDISPIEEWLSGIMSAETQTTKVTPQKHKIQKVPQMLREIESNKKCYDPVVVSIGPYHHGKPELESVEKFKIPLAKQYVNGCNPPCIDMLYEKVKEVAEDARNCYAQDSIEGFHDDDAFTRMMFLDGCFVLQFIFCIVENKPFEVKMKTNDIAFVQRDLFLLENQLPFQVLDALMSMRSNEAARLNIIQKFIKRMRAPPNEEQSRIKKVRSFFHLPFYRNQSDQKKKETSNVKPVHLLDLLWTELIGIEAFKTDRERKSGNDWNSYRSVEELKAAGIRFRPSKTDRFTDVKFEPQLIKAILRLPPMTIDDSTKSMLLNLVAYETCPDGPDNFGVTSYICFIDALIDRAEDVKVLRRKGILLNFLGSDEQVAELFNEIATDLVPNPEVYADVKTKIENHYKDRLKVWMADWMHTHFSSPWTVLAFAGAIFALLLSLIQTYLAIFPREAQK